MANSNNVSIYDCLNYFSMEETLSGNDKWYCGKCKDHVNAQKKMEVYKAPNYLIIHLKRFSHQRGMFGSRKLNDFINFPVNGLNMAPYIKDATASEDCIYDLYAVSNHFGSLGGGHYTAFCKNPVYEKWYDFDDTNVSRLNESDVVTKAAYVLFYKRRTAQM